MVLSGNVVVYPGEGEKIVAIQSFKGLLIVWKYPRGVYYIDTTAVDVGDWKTKRLGTSTGGVKCAFGSNS